MNHYLKKCHRDASFEAFTVVNIQVKIFWVVAQFSDNLFWQDTNVSEVYVASIFRLKGGSMDL